MIRAHWLLPLGFLVIAGTMALAENGPSDEPPLTGKAYVLPPRPWPGMRVSMDILVNGRPQPTVYWRGRTYLAVPEWGLPYQIRVTNHGSRRITAIVSVDGLSVINGRPASEEQPGYLVNPHSSIVIKGWRQNTETVAGFTFEERNRSYAAKVGRPENIGVIGLIAFEEMTTLPRELPLEQKNRTGAPAEGLAPKGTGGTGTGYGEPIYSPTYEVPFVRSHNKRTVVIYYDTAAALREAGVPVDHYVPNPNPNPFPGDPRFVSPPPALAGR